jgi:hypothetical protein
VQRLPLQSLHMVGWKKRSALKPFSQVFDHCSSSCANVRMLDVNLDVLCGQVSSG